jgi:hypothetical protein
MPFFGDEALGLSGLAVRHAKTINPQGAHMHKHRQRVVLVQLLVLALSACSTVGVYKASSDGFVPSNKNREDGFPFYLPRPYVQVYEPFVISSDAYLAVGRVSADGNYLLIESLPPALSAIAIASPSSFGGASAVPLAKVRGFSAKGTSKALPKGKYQSGTPEPSDDASPDETPPDKPASSQPLASAPAPGKVASSSSGTPAPDKPATEPASGKSKSTVSQSATPFVPTLGRRFFDVVWLPDFDEKYIIEHKPRLGNSKLGVTMTQGWGLFGLEAETDNSGLVGPLLNFYSQSLSALTKLTQSKILPGSLQSGTTEADSKELRQLGPGTPMSIKVTKVSVVAPGLYPVLKPAELERGKDAASSPLQAKVLRPVAPFTNIAFNVYEVLVVEATKPVGDSPMNLQKYFDGPSAGTGGGSSASNQQQGAVPTFDEAKFIKDSNVELAQQKGADGAHWQVTAATATSSSLRVSVKLVGGTSAPAALPTRAYLKPILMRFAPADLQAVNAIAVL